MALAMVLAGLTLVIVGVAIVRLQRYRDEFGLTELRLATTWFSVWLALVVVTVTCALAAPRLRWVLLVGASALAWLVAWNAYDPDRRIAETNIDRAIAGERFDADFLVGLSEDAVPVIVGRIDELSPAHHDSTLRSLCAGPLPRAEQGLGWNRARSDAREELVRRCGGERRSDRVITGG